jgi:hypothetical protein
MDVREIFTSIWVRALVIRSTFLGGLARVYAVAPSKKLLDNPIASCDGKS